MSSMGDIVAALAAIKKGLDAIDLTKETDVNKIKGMEKPTTEVDNVVKRDDFAESHLEATVTMFKEASDRVEAYDGKDDVAAAVKASGDINKQKEINDRMNARNAVKKAVQDKYKELSSKQKVISEYSKKYDPEFLISRQNDRMEAKKKKIEENKTKIAEIGDFKNSVSGELGVINNNLALQEALKKLEEQVKAVEKKENGLNLAKANGMNQAIIDGMEEDLKNAKAQLKKDTSELTKKYKGVTLDPNNLKRDIPAAITTAQASIDTAKAGIKTKAQNSSKDYIKTEILGRLNAASDDKAFVAVLDTARSELDAENINLGIQKEKIAGNIDQVRLGEQVRAAGPAAPMAEPTEEEIQAQIDADPSIRVPALTDKDMTEKVFEKIKGGLFKNSNSKWLHPIAALRSRFDKGAREACQKDHEKPMRDEAINRAKAAKSAAAQKNKDAATVSRDQESAWKKALFAKVMRADAASVEKMDKDADKKPGDLLVQAYDEVDDGRE